MEYVIYVWAMPEASVDGSLVITDVSLATGLALRRAGPQTNGKRKILLRTQNREHQKRKFKRNMKMDDAVIKRLQLLSCILHCPF